MTSSPTFTRHMYQFTHACPAAAAVTMTMRDRRRRQTLASERCDNLMGKCIVLGIRIGLVNPCSPLWAGSMAAAACDYMFPPQLLLL